MGATPLDAFHRRVRIAALVVHAITAWFSSGYYAADEHYQVIAFAQHKLGELPANELPWEYDARIRSAFLPGIAYGVIVASRSSLTSNPLHIAFLLRLITALVALAAVRSFIRSVIPRMNDDLHKPFILLSYFLWFLPYQHVRFAVETWSGSLFLLGLAQLFAQRGSGWGTLLTGLCFGLSMQVKPAMAIACAGIVGWLLMIDKARGSSMLLLLVGMLAASALGLIVDRWFYGTFTSTLWNYAVLAVRGDPAHVFEPYPWYVYVPWLMKYGIWPIGILLMVAFAWLSYRRPRSWVVWCVWPYLIALSLIQHKEVRFLFPLVDLAPVVLVLTGQEVGNSIIRMIKHGAVLVPLMAINACSLVTASTTAAGSARTRLAEALWADRTRQARSIGYDMEDERIWKARLPSFYLPAGMDDLAHADPCISAYDLPATPLPDILVAQESYGPGCTPESEGYRPIARSESRLAAEILDLYNSERFRPFALYAREARTSPPSEP